MGTNLVKENKSHSEMNLFLFEQYKKYINVEKNSAFIDLTSINENEFKNSNCFCFNSKSCLWKDHFLEKCKNNQEFPDLLKPLTNFVKKISSEKENYFLSKLSWQIFLFLNLPNQSTQMNIPKQSLVCEQEDDNSLVASDTRKFNYSFKGSIYSNYSENIIEKKIKMRNRKKIKKKEFMPNSFVNSRLETCCYDLDEELKKQKMMSLSLFKRISEEIENQMKNEKHCLGQLKSYFIEYFLSQFNNDNHEGGIALKIFKWFTETFTECLIIFYKIEKISEAYRKSTKPELNYLNFENFFVFTTNILFTNEIYEILFMRQIDEYDNGMETFIEKKKIDLESLTINDFGIPNEFHLQDNQLQKNLPYDKVINLLRGINDLKSPFFKFKLLNKVSESIAREVEEYYTNKNQKNCIQIDTDSFIALHIYIICKSQIKFFNSHLNFIDIFASEKHKMTVSGYYLTIFKAGLEYLKNIG